MHAFSETSKEMVQFKAIGALFGKGLWMWNLSLLLNGHAFHSRYLAPELHDGSSLKTVEFLRCDVWALGLLCLEVVWDGSKYFHLPEITSLKVWSQTAEGETKSSNEWKRSFSLCPYLSEAAAKSIDNLSSRQEFRPLQKTIIKGILRMTLQVDPSKRQHDLSKLPFIFGGGLHLSYVTFTLSFMSVDL
jgi:hypothetical protein